MNDWLNSIAGVATTCVQTFGQVVTYTPSGGGDPFQIQGIFDKDRLITRIEAAGIPVHGTACTLDILLTDYPNPQEGDLVEVSGSTWRVAEVELDQAGSAVLYLQPR